VDAAPAAVINGAGVGGPAVDSPPSNLHGSATVMSGGEWIDLRVSMCRDSTKLQSALLAGITAADQTLGTFPKREVTDDELAGRE